MWNSKKKMQEELKERERESPKILKMIFFYDKEKSIRNLHLAFSAFTHVVDN